jgi:uncharacterized protein (TIGR03435 family)
MTRKLMLAIVGIAATGALILAESAPPSQRPITFEVASIKLNSANDGRVAIMPTAGGRLTMTNSSLRMLIRFAYNLQDNQLVGGPAWLDTDRYDILAKAEGEATREQMQQMLQTLLAERFQLKVHRETRELPVYALVAAKGGSKLKPTDANPSAANGGIRIARGAAITQVEGIMSMEQFAQLLSSQLGRTIVDKTGLSGNYELKLQWSPDSSEGPRGSGGAPVVASGEGGAPPTDPSLTSVYTAIQEQLGIRLDAQKGPVPVLVIDSAQKPVTENRE